MRAERRIGIAELVDPGHGAAGNPQHEVVDELLPARPFLGVAGHEVALVAVREAAFAGVRRVDGQNPRGYFQGQKRHFRPSKLDGGGSREVTYCAPMRIAVVAWIAVCLWVGPAQALSKSFNA